MQGLVAPAKPQTGELPGAATSPSNASGRCQNQKFTARAFHGAPSNGWSQAFGSIWAKCPGARTSLLYSIISSASTCIALETVRPSVLAVLRLITSSKVVGRMTGRSAGLAPLRIRPA